MNLDPELIKAVEDSVKEAGQKASVAALLIAWLDASSKGAVTAEDDSRRLDLIRSALTLKEGVSKHED